MDYQVFISHSSKNADIAAAMKSYLEAREIKCWKAPEDIPYGTDWDIGIINGLSQCSVMVLIFSKEADDSGHVKKELVFADNQKKIIIPFKIDGYMPTNLAYFLALPQWLDGVMDIEAAFGDLYNRLQAALGGSVPPGIPVGPVIPRGPGSSGSPGGPETTRTPGNPGGPQRINDKADIETLLQVLPEYRDWASNSDLRSRLGWDKEKLKRVAEELEKEKKIIYREGSGGAMALRTEELSCLEQRIANGEDHYPFFVNVGEDNSFLSPDMRNGSWRHWDDFRKYGFISAGGGARFAKQMQNIPIGAEVYAYISGSGYVGRAKVTEKAVPMDKFVVDGIQISSLPLVAPNALLHLGNYEMCEWMVRVDWIKALDRAKAIKKTGLFVYVATSCRIKDPISIKYLREQFARI